MAVPVASTWGIRTALVLVSLGHVEVTHRCHSTAEAPVARGAGLIGGAATDEVDAMLVVHEGRTSEGGRCHVAARNGHVVHIIEPTIAVAEGRLAEGEEDRGEKRDL